MCGINGFNFSDKALIEKMTACTKHRGPDGTDVYNDAHMSLGHNRLSIIDLSDKGAQPMKTKDGNVIIVFNGEIYNHRGLRKELEKKGRVFVSNSDTEVLLQLYEEYGSECVKKLNGMFAFAIWDKKENALFAARDHIGIKPLFYYWDGKKFIFSSELSGILVHDVPKRINKTALNAYFQLLHVPAPETLISGVQKLLPGHYLFLKEGKLSIKKYWEVDDFENYSIPEEGLKEKIETELRKAVTAQMISDVPIGLFLSGGIDSSLILGLMAESVNMPIETFSVGFLVEEESEKFNTDHILARETAKRFGADHHEFMIGAGDVRENIENIFLHMSDLVANPAQVATYLLSQKTKDFVKVVLGGDGGDELFGGYRRHYYYQMVSRWQKLPRIIRDNILQKTFFNALGKKDAYMKLNGDNPLNLWWFFMAQKKEDLSCFIKQEYFDYNSPKEYVQKNYFDDIPKADLPKQMMHMDLHTWLPGASLSRTDQMTMAHGLEQRVPILDVNVVKLAMKIPTAYKLGDKKQGKVIFKDAMKRYLPPAVYDKEKTGWFLPTSKWLRTGLKDVAYQILSEHYNEGTKEFFDFNEIRKILDDHISKKKYALNTIWALIAFQVWWKKVFEGDP